MPATRRPRPARPGVATSGTRPRRYEVQTEDAGGAWREVYATTDQLEARRAYDRLREPGTAGAVRLVELEVLGSSG